MERDEQVLTRRRNQLAARVRDPLVRTMSLGQLHRCEDTLVEVIGLSTFALIERLETVAIQYADDDCDPDSIAFRRASVLPILLALRYEAQNRARLRREGKAPAMVRTPAHDELRALLADIKARVTISDLLERETAFHVLHGRHESHSGCPMCGEGHDRFVIKHDVPSWAWCRRCHWAPDVIGLAAALWGLSTNHGADLREIAVRLAGVFAPTANDMAAIA
jgi:hypothetical protein